MPQFDASIELSTLNGNDGFRLSGEVSGDNAGGTIAIAGDVNGDGYADMLVAARSANDAAGMVYVVYGGDAGFPAALDLGTLDGTNGFTIAGLSPHDELGKSVAGAGDVNGDGIGDIIVGAWGVDDNSSDRGASYIIFGKAGGFSATLDLASLDGTNGFRLVGAVTEDYLGGAVSGAGDIDNDGFDDVIVGAHFAYNSSGDIAGQAYVVYGKNGGFPSSIASQSVTAIDGDQSFAGFGGAVSSAGDVNGDGFDDVFVGAPFAMSYYNSGIGYVVLGSADGIAAPLDAGALDGKNGFRIAGNINSAGLDSGAELGATVASAGDVNADGYGDLIIGAPSFGIEQGAAFVILGGAGGFPAEFDPTALDGSNGFAIHGAIGEGIARSVTGVGDVNGDGFDDVAFTDGSTPAAYVLFGRAGGFAASMDPSAIDGETGFKITLTPGTPGTAGIASLAGGDVNGDGFSDIIVGTPGDYGYNGGAFVVLGHKPDEAVTRTGTALGNTIHGSDSGDTLSGLGGADTLIGYKGDDTLAGGVGDDAIDGGDGSDTAQFSGGWQDYAFKDNGDGSYTITDLRAGTSDGTDTLRGIEGFAFDNGTFTAGELLDPQVYPAAIQLSGLAQPFGLAIDAQAAGDRLGFSVAGAGDVNGDGIDDFIVGATEADPHGSRSGSAYVVFGSGSGIVTDLSKLDGSNGFRIDGEVGGGRLGWAVSAAGDVNGDGFDDVIVSAARADTTYSYSGGSYPASEGGITYVVFGKGSGFGATLDVSSLDGSNGFAFSGYSYSHLGSNVSNLGDINGDGFDDVAATTWYDNGYGSWDPWGTAYVVFGKASGFPADIDGDQGAWFSRQGAQAVSVSAAGDVNGDGIDDMIVGIGTDSSHNAAGEAYVVFGRTSGFSGYTELATLDGTTGFKLTGAKADDYAGYSVSGGGDINGDGFADLIVGAYGVGDYQGAAYVVFGKASGFGANLDLSSLDGSNGFRINGEAPYDSAGGVVGHAGDFNGDGFDDVVIMAWGTDNTGYSSGSVYVVFGKAGGFAADLDLAALDGSNGIEIMGAGNGADISSVKGAGDVNADGLDDIVIGTSNHNGGDGQASIVFGRLPLDAVTREGTAIANTIHGGNKGDTLSGLAGDDTLIGHGGDDTLMGGSGDDAIDGGDSIDTAVFTGKATDYKFTVAGDTLIVEDLRSGTPDGSDTLTRIEHIKLADSTVSVLELTNHAPTGAALSVATIAEGSAAGTVVGTLSAIDQDTKLGDTATFILTDDAGGAFALDGDKLVVADGSKLDYESATTVTVEVEVTDKFGLSASQKLTIGLTDENDTAPVITTAATLSVAEGKAIVAVLTATDKDTTSEIITFSVTGGADAALFDVAAGNLVLKSPLDFETDKHNYSVEVTASDGVNTTKESITVGLIDANDTAPVITTGATQTVAEGTTIIVTLTSTDVDTTGETVTYAVTGGKDAALFDVVGGKLALKAPRDFEKDGHSYTVEVTASDGTSSSAKTFTIGLTDTNDTAPSFTTAATQSVAEGATLVTALASIDPDTVGGPVTYSITGGADAALFAISGGDLVLRSPRDFETQAHSYAVEVAASDGVNSTKQAISVNLTDVNDTAPVITTAATLSVSENATIVAALTATDKDTTGEPVTFTVSGGADAALFDVVGGNLVLKAARDFETDAHSYEVEVTVSDGVNTSKETITVNLTDANDVGAVITMAAKQTVAEGQTFVAEVTSYDPDTVGFIPPQYLLLSGVDDNDLFEIVDGDLRLRAPLDYETDRHNFTVQLLANDGGQITGSTITVNLTDANDVAPHINSANAFSIAENATKVGALTAVDADTTGETIAFSVTGGADAALFDVVGGNLVFKAGRDFETQAHAYKVEVTASDGVNNTSQSITVSLTDLNDTAPVITTAATQSVAEGAVFVTVIASVDADSVPVAATYSLGGADAALFEIQGTDLWFRNPADYETDPRSYSVDVIASDGVNSSTKTISVALTDENDNAPVITTPSNVSVAENYLIVTSLTSTDADETGLAPAHFSLSGGADMLLFAIEGGNLVFRTGHDYETEKHVFEVEVSAFDGLHMTSKAITVHLTDAAEKPLKIVGTAKADNLVGDTGGDTVAGLGGNDLLAGWDGNDILDGGAGNDLLFGGRGDDVLKGGAGTDVVSYDDATVGVTVDLNLKGAQDTRGAGFDTLSGIENILGSFHDDTLTGNASANVLVGGQGADRMTGKGGNDTYWVDDFGDEVVEAVNGGKDSVISSIDFDLSATPDIENLSLIDGAVVGFGNDLANVITGNAQSNSLLGGLGRDVFVFNQALGGGNVDTIADFNVADDTIKLDRSIFTAFSRYVKPGTLQTSAFTIGTQAADASDRIIYDNASGALYYDADGTGVEAQQMFAMVSPGLALTQRDFTLF